MNRGIRGIDEGNEAREDERCRRTNGTGGSDDRHTRWIDCNRAEYQAYTSSADAYCEGMDVTY